MKTASGWDIQPRRGCFRNVVDQNRLLLYRSQIRIVSLDRCGIRATRLASGVERPRCANDRDLFAGEAVGQCDFPGLLCERIGADLGRVVLGGGSVGKLSHARAGPVVAGACSLQRIRGGMRCAATCAKSNGAGVRSSYFVFRAPIEHGDARSRMGIGRFGVANGVRLRRPVQMQTLLPSAGWSFGSFMRLAAIAACPRRAGRGCGRCGPVCGRHRRLAECAIEQWAGGGAGSCRQCWRVPSDSQWIPLRRCPLGRRRSIGAI